MKNRMKEKLKRMGEKSKSITLLLTINYILIVLVMIASLIFFVAFTMIRLTLYYENISKEEVKLAEGIVRKDYKEIEAKGILKAGGWVEIIDSNNDIVYVIGEKKDDIVNYNLYNMISNGNPAIDFSEYYVDAVSFQGEDGEAYICLVKIPHEEVYDTQNMVGMNNRKIVFKRYLVQGLIGAVFILISSMTLIGYFSMGMIAKPLTKIKEGINEMIEGNYSVRLDFSTFKEINELKNSFNYMVDKLDRAEEEKREIEESKKRIIRDMSHDIKTPITSILGYSKVLKDEAVKDEEKKKIYLDYIYNKTLRLNSLVDELFSYTKLDSPDYRINAIKQDFIIFLQETILLYYGDMERKDFQLEIEVPDKAIEIPFDAEAMERALGNILSNAVKYNPHHTNLKIRLLEDENYIFLVIKDDGIGMEKEIADQIFNEFVRGDVARSSDGGSGLGLSITKRIIKLHGGEIFVESEPKKGTKFVIRLNKEG